MYQLVLASASPRRRQLLKEAGFSFLVHPSQISETFSENMTLDEQLCDLSRRKAEAVYKEYEKIHQDPFLVLAADTEVVVHGEALGKPSDEREAMAFLKLLSGCFHEVKTALFLKESIRGDSFSHLETTRIEFRDLTDQEIQDYIKTGEPFDKAGGYAIQGLGGQFVKRHSGSWTNVVGLPVEKLAEILESKNWSVEGS
jgi:septum formation protein